MITGRELLTRAGTGTQSALAVGGFTSDEVACTEEYTATLICTANYKCYLGAV